MKTYLPKAQKVSEWFLIDATNIPMGRLAETAAKILRGKNAPDYTPFFDRGDSVVIINAEKVKLTGKKLAQKTYFSHSGYPGGEHYKSIEKMGWQKVIRSAVYGMLPKNKLRDKQIIRLYTYEGPEHTHTSQNPKVIEVK